MNNQQQYPQQPQQYSYPVTPQGYPLQPQQQYVQQPYQQPMPYGFQQPPHPRQFEKYYLQQQLQEMSQRVPPEKRSSFGSLEYRPRHVTFATQDDNEYVYLLVRRHWITNLGWVIRSFFMALLPPLTLYILAFFEIKTDLVNEKGIFLALLAYYSFIITGFVASFFDWYFDPYIVTNERIVSYDFKPFTSYTIDEATLGNIEDVREQSIGPISSIFNFGTIRILTASDRTEILFLLVPQPTKVRDIIADLAKIYNKYHGVIND